MKLHEAKSFLAGDHFGLSSEDPATQLQLKEKVRKELKRPTQGADLHIEIMKGRIYVFTDELSVYRIARHYRHKDVWQNIGFSKPVNEWYYAWDLNF